MDDLERWRARMKQKGIDVDQPLGPVTPEQVASLAAQGIYPRLLVMRSDGTIEEVEVKAH